MYEVFLDGVQIYSPGNPELVILNGKLELGDNKSGSFEFDLPIINPAYDRIKKMTSEIIVKKDGEAIFYGRCLSIDRDFNNMKSVVCEGELAYLLDSIQEPKEFHNYTVRQFLAHLINVHNAQTNNTKMFTVGQTTVTDPNDSLYRYTNWETTLDDIMDKLVDRLGGHIRIRHSGSIRYIDYIEDFDNTNTQVIEFGENLLDYAENMDASDIATRIIPLGARLETSDIEVLEEYTTIKSVNNNIPYVESEAAIKNFGIITKTVSFDDVTVPANLKTKAQKYLSDVQYENLCLTCKAIDLNMVDGNVESIKLGDSIRVLSPPHGMDRYFPVTALTIYFDKPEDNTVTLGTNVKAGLSERTAGDNSAVIKRINSIPPLSQALSMAKENATALITAATTGHVVTRPNEILIMDTADTETATKVWRWNVNGLGYSKNGYQGTYELAMTMDGTIMGDRIAAGTVSAAKLDINYTGQVEQAIADAESNANVYTDTQISNSASSITLEAKSYTDSKLSSYATKSELTVGINGIQSQVSSKVDQSQFSTLITQNAQSVKVAWNNISNYVSIENGGMYIYDENNKQLAFFGQNGETFTDESGGYIGSIGGRFETVDYLNDQIPFTKGLTFALDTGGHYMGFAAKNDRWDKYYYSKLMYVSHSLDSDAPYDKKGWHLGDMFYAHQNVIQDAVLQDAYITYSTIKYPQMYGKWNNFEFSGFTGTIYYVSDVNYDGSNLTTTKTPLTFSSGILLDMSNWPH